MSNNIILSEYDSLKKNITNVYSTLLKEYNYVNMGKLIILMDFWLDLFFIADKNNLELRENRMDLVDKLFSRYYDKAIYENLAFLIFINRK